MPSTATFLQYTQWVGILTLICAVLAGLGFVFSWGIRFRLVGVTGFSAVLTVGLFALTLGLYAPVTIPGAVKFSTIYDTGATQVVIAVSNKITQPELEATLRQAAYNLFSTGRMGRAGEPLTIRARTVMHRQPGLSQPLYLGEVKRSLATRNDEQMQITIYRDNFAQLPKSAA